MPLELALVEGPAESHSWREQIDLGCRVPFGAQPALLETGGSSGCIVEPATVLQTGMSGNPPDATVSTGSIKFTVKSKKHLCLSADSRCAAAAMHEPHAVNKHYAAYPIGQNTYNNRSRHFMFRIHG